MGFIGEDRLKDLLTKLKATFYTESQVDTKIADAIGDINSFDITVVDALPTTGEKNKFYLVPATTVGTNDFYNEYVWIESSSKFELVGSTAIDLTLYAKKTDLDDYAKKTSVPVVSDSYSSTSTDAMSGKAVASAISGVSNQVTVSQVVASGTEIAKISVNGNATSIYAPKSSNVTISSEEGNAIIQKTDGIYVSDEGGKEVEVSDDTPTDDGIVLWVDTDENYMGSYASVVEYHEYSTDEKVIGQWIDGKPVYRKMYTLSDITVTSTNKNTTICSVDNIYLIKAYGTCTWGTTGHFLIPYVTSVTGVTLQIQEYQDNIVLSAYRTSGSTVCSDIRIFLEYTKTADAENSFDTTQLDYTVDDEVSDADVDEVVDSL